MIIMFLLILVLLRELYTLQKDEILCGLEKSKKKLLYLNYYYYYDCFSHWIVMVLENTLAELKHNK